MALFDPKQKVIANYQKSIDEKRASIKRYYDEIGRLYYGQYKDLNVDNTKDINTRCEAVTRLGNEIEELNLKILYEKGLKLCPNCRTENSLEYTFCFKCGARFEEQKKEEAAPANVEDPVAPVAAEEVEVESVDEVKAEEKAEEAAAPAEEEAKTEE